MHNSSELVRLHGAVDYVISRLNYRVPQERRIRGVLKIYDVEMAELEFVPVLNTCVGDFVPMFANNFTRLEAQSDRAFGLFERHQQDQQLFLSKGFSSSDMLLEHAGAVWLGDLIVSFTDLHSNDEGLRDEAIVLMSTIRAGFLSKGKVSSLRCRKGRRQFNPALKRMMSDITWTN